MKGHLSLSDRQEIVQRLSRLVYFAKADDAHSMSSCFSTLVEEIYGELSFLPSDSSEDPSDDSSSTESDF
jgi:hypothetical protein